MPSVRASSPILARSVRRPSTGVRSSLKSPVCNNDALGCVHGDGMGVGHAVGDRDELDIERADLHPFVVGDDAELGVAEQAGLFDAVAGEAERHGRAVDRHG